MTTMSITLVRPTAFSNRPAHRDGLARMAAARARASSPIINRQLGRVLGVTGRFTLALVPFSFLAWMFVAN
jgi:hypothetical protein